VTYVTEDDLDDLEFATIRSGDHAAAARRLVELSEEVSGGVPRAEVLVRAGQQWQHAGDHERAVELYQRAIEDGGAPGADPLVCLADAYFELDRAEDARHLLDQISASAPTDPDVHRSVAELLYEQGDLVGAHEWATTGADLVRTSGDAGDDLEGLLRTRYRCRLDLGWPEDHYDVLLDDLLKKTQDAPPGQFR
jgi:tetratricopeptide (TPR) repeat protein